MHPTVSPCTQAIWSSSIGTGGRHASERVDFFIGSQTNRNSAARPRLELLRRAVRAQALLECHRVGRPVDLPQLDARRRGTASGTEGSPRTVSRASSSRCHLARDHKGDGRQPAAISLLGNYMAARFITAADGHGGRSVQAGFTGLPVLRAAPARDGEGSPRFSP